MDREDGTVGMNPLGFFRDRLNAHHYADRMCREKKSGYIKVLEIASEL